MQNGTKISEHLEPAVEASNRARYVLILILSAGILVFIPTWSSAFFSWQNLHLEYANVALQLCRQGWQIGKGESATAQAEILHRIDRYAPETKNVPCDDLRRDYDSLERTISENVNFIRLPIFGVVVDINDTAVLGGIAFVVLLGLFRFSLLREHLNLKLFFAEARRRHDLRTWYTMLAMRQVLTVPPTPYHSRRGFWEKLARWLPFFPVGIQLFTIFNDVYSISSGILISPGRTGISFIFGSSLLILIVILSSACARLSRRIDGEWQLAARELSLVY